jgi:glycosyltransferase involved in cell wall biosynthesis
MKSVRLLVISHTGSRSGAEIVLSRIVTGAHRHGWDVTALIPPGPTAESVAAAGADVTSIPELTLDDGPKAAAGARLCGRNALAVPTVRRAARQADLVLVNGLLGLPVVAAARLRTPVVWLVHDIVTRRDRVFVARLTGRFLRGILAVSEVAAAPVRAMGFPVVVIPPGTPYPVATRSDRDHGPGLSIVGCAAALTPWKGQDVLLNAFAEVAARDAAVTLEFIGGPFPRDIEYAHSLRRRSEASDLRGRVRFLGYRQDALPEVRRWTIAVSASVEPEAVGLSTLEAMSLGVPVVGTALGATPQLLGASGLLVPPGDPRAMAGAIRNLLEDGDLWDRCHSAGPARVRERYRLDDQIDRTLDILDGLAGPTMPAGTPVP